MDQSVESNLTSNTIKNQTVEDDEYGTSLNGDYDYYGDLFLFNFNAIINMSILIHCM